MFQVEGGARAVGEVCILPFLRMELPLSGVRKKIISAPSNFVHFFPAWNFGLITDHGWARGKLKPLL